jgi:hypothetical protein
MGLERRQFDWPANAGRLVPGTALRTSHGTAMPRHRPCMTRNGMPAIAAAQAPGYCLLLNRHET